MSVGIVGNCQAELLHEALRAAAGDALGPSFYHAFAAPTPERLADLSRCRMLLVQDIGENADYFARFAPPAGLSRLDLPCLRFASPWP